MDGTRRREREVPKGEREGTEGGEGAVRVARDAVCRVVSGVAGESGESRRRRIERVGFVVVSVGWLRRTFFVWSQGSEIQLVGLGGANFVGSSKWENIEVFSQQPDEPLRCVPH
jgi:hypothetical protein